VKEKVTNYRKLVAESKYVNGNIWEGDQEHPSSGYGDRVSVHQTLKIKSHKQTAKDENEKRFIPKNGSGKCSPSWVIQLCKY